MGHNRRTCGSGKFVTPPQNSFSSVHSLWVVDSKDNNSSTSSAYEYNRSIDQAEEVIGPTHGGGWSLTEAGLNYPGLPCLPRLPLLETSYSSLAPTISLLQHTHSTHSYRKSLVRSNEKGAVGNLVRAAWAQEGVKLLQVAAHATAILDDGAVVSKFTDKKTYITTYLVLHAVLELEDVEEDAKKLFAKRTKLSKNEVNKIFSNMRDDIIEKRKVGMESEEYREIIDEYRKIFYGANGNIAFTDETAETAIEMLEYAYGTDIMINPKKHTVGRHPTPLSVPAGRHSRDDFFAAAKASNPRVTVGQSLGLQLNPLSWFKTLKERKEKRLKERAKKGHVNGQKEILQLIGDSRMGAKKNIQDLSSVDTRVTRSLCQHGGSGNCQPPETKIYRKKSSDEFIGRDTVQRFLENGGKYPRLTVQETERPFSEELGHKQVNGRTSEYSFRRVEEILEEWSKQQ